jgi:hypothetical protein
MSKNDTLLILKCINMCLIQVSYLLTLNPFFLWMLKLVCDISALYPSRSAIATFSPSGSFLGCLELCNVLKSSHHRAPDMLLELRTIQPTFLFICATFDMNPIGSKSWEGFVVDLFSNYVTIFYLWYYVISYKNTWTNSTTYYKNKTYVAQENLCTMIKLFKP